MKCRLKTSDYAKTRFGQHWCGVRRIAAIWR